MMRLVQFLKSDGQRAVAMSLGEQLQRVDHFPTIYELATGAIMAHKTIGDLVSENLSKDFYDYGEIIDSDRLLSPIGHPDPARFWITGTGLTHAGSAAARDAMHKALEKEDLSDSMKMFKMGLEGGKASNGRIGVQPEWFYKGNGHSIVPPGGSLDFPEYAMDGGEEPEIAGIYLIGQDGIPYRIGFALGNEYSDHVMERINYLYLSHSKLRHCSFGPELLLGEFPKHIEGRVTVSRSGEALWTKEFLSGSDHMIHSLENLEHHHFKYGLFRNPGDLHCHFLGTATFSFSDGIQAADGDLFTVESPLFGRPLVNTVKKGQATKVQVKVL